jgi:hypothetical protein
MHSGPHRRIQGGFFRPDDKQPFVPIAGVVVLICVVHHGKNPNRSCLISQSPSVSLTLAQKVEVSLQEKIGHEVLNIATQGFGKREVDRLKRDLIRIVHNIKEYEKNEQE